MTIHHIQCFDHGAMAHMLGKRQPNESTTIFIPIPDFFALQSHIPIATPEKFQKDRQVTSNTNIVLTANLAFSRSWGSYNLQLQVFFPRFSVQVPPLARTAARWSASSGCLAVKQRPSGSWARDCIARSPSGTCRLWNRLRSWSNRRGMGGTHRRRWSVTDGWEKLQATGHHFCSIKDGDVLKCFP